ncbi:hypothetical protein M3Y94_01018200 [Aphelenchoides besseyi]|nr:hypothetical protein M3Y94_01018200 [Aphelenchoides besseyi]
MDPNVKQELVEGVKNIQIKAENKCLKEMSSYLSSGFTFSGTHSGQTRVSFTDCGRIRLAQESFVRFFWPRRLVFKYKIVYLPTKVMLTFPSVEENWVCHFLLYFTLLFMWEKMAGTCVEKDH